MEELGQNDMPKWEDTEEYIPSFEDTEEIVSQKKKPIGNAPPTGGKVGASEIPSTGSSPFLQKAKERAEQGEPTVLSVKKETVKEVGQPAYTPTKEEELKAPTQKQFEQQAALPTYEKENALDISKKQTQVATERSKALDELIKSKKEAQSSYEKVRNLDSQIESFEPQFEKFKTTAEAFQPDIQEYKNLTSKIAEIKNKSNLFVLEYNNEYQKLAPKLDAYKQIFENEKLPNEKRQDAYENYNGIVSILKNKEKLLDQAVAQNEQGIGDLEVRAKSFDETIKKATANQAGFSQLYSQYKSLIDERNKSAEGLGVYEKRMSDAQNQIKQKLFEQSQLEDVRQQKLEKEYSTWQNLIESLPKMGIEAVAGFSDMLNVLGFSGDPESPETRDEVKKETRQNIEKLRKFGDSFITQELPKNYEKLFEGQFSLKKLANVGFNAIASTAPTVAAGLIGGPAAGVAAGAGMAFGESKEIMKEAGLTEEQAEAAAFGLSIPIGLLDKYGAEDFVKLFSKEAVEYSTKIFLKNIAGRTLTKEQLFNEAKNTIGQIIKDGAPQLFKEGVKESGTEVSQGAVNEVAKQVAQEFTGVDIDENMSWSDYLKEQAEVRGEEAIGGFIGGTSMQTIGLGLKSAGEGVFPTFNPSAYQKALELIDPSKMEAFSQEVQQEVQDKVLTQEQADLAFRNIQLIQETNKLIPATINNKDLRTEALNLLIEKKETQKEIEGKDEALVAPQKARIEEINKRLSDIANGKEEEVVIPTVTLNKNTTPTEEKYGTIDRGDGKGIVDLTRAEYEAEVAKQGGVEREEVKPMVTEVQFTTKQRERRDQEIEEVQQLRSDLGQDVELINDIPSFVDDVVDRIDLGMMVAPEMAKDAILELDKQFDKLQAYRNDPSRTHTTAQIDAMIDVLGAVKSEIQDYQIKQKENGQQQQTTATKTEPTTAPVEGVEAGKEQVTPTTEEEKGESSVPGKTDKAYQEAQGVTERISKAHPEASVLITPKGDDLLLTALYVGKEKRGKGIGSGVLESVKAEADKLGKKIVLDATNELDSETDLERLGNFYERNGFEKVGENKFEYTPKETPQAGSVGVGGEVKSDELVVKKIADKEIKRQLDEQGYETKNKTAKELRDLYKKEIGTDEYKEPPRNNYKLKVVSKKQVGGTDIRLGANSSDRSIRNNTEKYGEPIFDEKTNEYVWKTNTLTLWEMEDVETGKKYSVFGNKEYPFSDIEQGQPPNYGYIETPKFKNGDIFEVSANPEINEKYGNTTLKNVRKQAQPKAVEQSLKETPQAGSVVGPLTNEEDISYDKIPADANLNQLLKDEKITPLTYEIAYGIRNPDYLLEISMGNIDSELSPSDAISFLEKADLSNLTLSKIYEAYQNELRYPTYMSPVEEAISNNFSKNISANSWNRFADKNLMSSSIAKTYGVTRKSKFGLDQVALGASMQMYGYEGISDQITTDDVVDFMLRFPNGYDNIPSNNPKLKTLSNIHIKATGKSLDGRNLKSRTKKQSDIEEKKRLDLLNAEIEQIKLTEEEMRIVRDDEIALAEEFDKWYDALTDEQKQQFITDEKTTDTSRKGRMDDEVQKTSENAKKPTKTAGSAAQDKVEPTISDDLNNFLKGDKGGLMQPDTDAMVKQFVEIKRKQGIDDNELRKGLEDAADKGII